MCARAPLDAVEAEGIARAVAARETASLTVLVLDRSSALTEDDRALLELTAARPRVVVANKADLRGGVGRCRTRGPGHRGVGADR